MRSFCYLFFNDGHKHNTQQGFVDESVIVKTVDDALNPCAIAVLYTATEDNAIAATVSNFFIVCSPK